MSDCFNHCLDAYEDLGRQVESGEFTGFGNKRSKGCSTPYDPLFYHSKVTFEKLEHETASSFLLKINGHKLWIPKKICRKFNLDSKTVYIHTETYLKIIRKDINEKA